MRKINLEGQRFGRWLVIEEAEKPRYYRCICDCGKEKDVFSGNLRNGCSLSCGCLSAEMTKVRETTHGMHGTKTYSVYREMLRRAQGKSTNAVYYAERGIGVSDSWAESFENFFEDMGECPEGLWLERIDNNKGYCKENCKWETPSRQASNRRRRDNKSGRMGVHFDTHSGKWKAEIFVDKKRIGLGRYVNFEDACDAVEKAELELLGYSRKDGFI
jgi:hypothetical protein